MYQLLGWLNACSLFLSAALPNDNGMVIEAGTTMICPCLKKLTKGWPFAHLPSKLTAAHCLDCPILTLLKLIQDVLHLTPQHFLPNQIILSIFTKPYHISTCYHSTLQFFRECHTEPDFCGRIMACFIQPHCQT